MADNNVIENPSFVKQEALNFTIGVLVLTVICCVINFAGWIGVSFIDSFPFATLAHYGFIKPTMPIWVVGLSILTPILACFGLIGFSFLVVALLGASFRK